jgi:hypothetical protein
LSSPQIRELADLTAAQKRALKEAIDREKGAQKRGVK